MVWLFRKAAGVMVSACAPKKTLGKLIPEKKIYPVYPPPNLLPPLGEGKGRGHPRRGLLVQCAVLFSFIINSIGNFPDVFNYLFVFETENL